MTVKHLLILLSLSMSGYAGPAVAQQTQSLT